MSNITFDPTTLSQSTNKTVIITGAARGIGAATAKLFNQHGANVVLADLSQFRAAAENLINSEFAHPERAIFVTGSIVNWAELTACFKTAIQKFGSLDVVVANAGIMESRPVLDLSVDKDGELREDEEAGSVIDVNLKGTLNSIIPSTQTKISEFLMCSITALRLALFHMTKNPDVSHDTPKSILLVGSTSSYFGGTGVTAYVASKHGILGLLRASQSEARELGVRINAVAPFFTPTYVTAGFAAQWRESGLEENTPELVAETIALVSLDEGRSGECVLVAGRYLRELEGSRMRLLPDWVGEDVANFMARAMRFFVSIGGYVLPKKY
ncbi:hypothetical protein N7532_011300 [Penicillium argentinense]|uniref:Ketoreductase domain-containing protein n=1 Tax=Penicillium argentinense TaxID=1131581 RepID=A0A9W9EI65_9EURO|nr:uncharacterized protein N7532_011300 [Penicillium argentinense]KAJ5082257.1 hypothetical protein N7532_011300 [Penicillium argentinense]